MRVLLILVSILAACTFPPIGGNKSETAEIPDTVIPDSPPVEVIAPRKEPVRPRKATTKPADTLAEPDLINPVAGCENVDIDDPKEAARAKLDCMKERLGVTE